MSVRQKYGLCGRWRWGKDTKGRWDSWSWQESHHTHHSYVLTPTSCAHTSLAASSAAPAVIQAWYAAWRLWIPICRFLFSCRPVSASSASVSSPRRFAMTTWCSRRRLAAAGHVHWFSRMESCASVTTLVPAPTPSSSPWSVDWVELQKFLDITSSYKQLGASFAELHSFLSSATTKQV